MQYTEALLQRIEKHSCINAFAHLNAEKVSVRLWQASICVRATTPMHQGQTHQTCHTSRLHAQPCLMARHKSTDPISDAAGVEGCKSC